jgi:holo-[acyl-carrier protein] synthase
MIVGSGIDLCEVPRIEQAIARHGHRFVERIFTPGEIAYADRKANRSERYAARFAAKEAGMKALGTGWSGGIAWRDFEVANLPSGRPTLRFHGKAAEIAAKLGVRNIALSLTHTHDQAMAVVILES